jgi:hypothetical protein
MYDIGDLAVFAEEIGYGYNESITIMEKDRFVPFYEAKYKELYIGMGKDYGFSPELTNIIDKFVEVHGECEIVQ